MQIFLKTRGGSTSPSKIQGGLRPPNPPYFGAPDIRCINGRFISFVIGCQDNNNNKVILYLNEYYILYCEFIDRVCEKITNKIEK